MRVSLRARAAAGRRRHPPETFRPPVVKLIGLGPGGSPMKSSKLFALALLALTLFTAPEAFAQSDRGSITGTVTDPNGAVVSSAKITATSLDTGEVREVTTGDEGGYTLPELKAGRWRVSAEAAGFKTTTVEEYKVAVQVTHSIDFKLELGAVTDVVTVTSESAPVL